MKQETLGYFIGSKAFSFPNLGGGKKQYNEDHQYDQGQTWSPKAGGEIDSPGGRPQNPRGNAEKAWHEELIILLGMSYSAANYIMDDSQLLSKWWEKMGAVGSDGVRMWLLMVFTSCIYGHPEIHSLLSRTINMLGETKKKKILLLLKN